MLVSKIGQGFALSAGLRPGDFIREVNGRPINTVAELVAVSNGGNRAWTVTIERGGQRISARFNTCSPDQARTTDPARNSAPGAAVRTTSTSS